MTEQQSTEDTDTDLGAVEIASATTKEIRMTDVIAPIQRNTP